MTHASIPKEDREKSGVTDQLVSHLMHVRDCTLYIVSYHHGDSQFKKQ